ncbi:MAG: hypothetical protein ACREYE_28285 [Gammaproteobacteria bacterium]
MKHPYKVAQPGAKIDYSTYGKSDTGNMVSGKSGSVPMAAHSDDGCLLSDAFAGNMAFKPGKAPRVNWSESKPVTKQVSVGGAINVVTPKSMEQPANPAEKKIKVSYGY